MWGVNECLDLLGKSFKVSEARQQYGYWQVAIDGGNKAKTTFASYMELYRFLQMRFSLKNTRSSFQRAIDKVLSTGHGAVCTYIRRRHLQLLEVCRRTSASPKNCIEPTAVSWYIIQAEDIAPH